MRRESWPGINYVESTPMCSEVTGPQLCSLIAHVIDLLGHKDASGKEDLRNICFQVG